MILGGKDVESKILLRSDLGDLLDVGCPRCRDDRLAFEVIDRFKIRRLLRDKPVGGNEMSDGKANLFLAIEYKSSLRRPNLSISEGSIEPR